MLKVKVRKPFERILLISVVISLATIVLMGVFVLKEGYPIIKKVGLVNFILGREWSPSSEIFGVFPMIIGTMTTTAGALLLAVPTSVMTAIFLTEFAPKEMERLLNPAIELLAGIPSVIYGLFGMTTVVPIIRHVEKSYFSRNGQAISSGYSLLAAIMILSIMISPTIINISKDALKGVKRELREASLALGATHWQMVSQIVLPSAKSGIMSGVILGMGRAIGETMAVIMVAGNTVKLPQTVFSPIRTLTSNIAIEISYASAGLHTQALFGTAIVLFVMIMLINSLAIKLYGKGVNIK